MMTNDITTMTASELKPFGQLLPNARVRHISQRDNMFRKGTPMLAIVGTITQIGFNINTGRPVVEVLWDGPEGGLMRYHTDQIALALA